MKNYYMLYYKKIDGEFSKQLIFFSFNKRLFKQHEALMTDLFKKIDLSVKPSMCVELTEADLLIHTLNYCGILIEIVNEETFLNILSDKNNKLLVKEII